MNLRYQTLIFGIRQSGKTTLANRINIPTAIETSNIMSYPLEKFNNIIITRTTNPELQKLYNKLAVIKPDLSFSYFLTYYNDLKTQNKYLSIDMDKLRENKAENQIFTAITV